MSTAEAIGSFGVGLLLVAFALHQSGKLSKSSRIYLWLNATGAGIACYASYLIGFYPFVVLEGTWCAAALWFLARPAGRT